MGRGGMGARGEGRGRFLRPADAPSRLQKPLEFLSKIGQSRCVYEAVKTPPSLTRWRLWETFRVEGKRSGGCWAFVGALLRRGIGHGEWPWMWWQCEWARLVASRCVCGGRPIGIWA